MRGEHLVGAGEHEDLVASRADRSDHQMERVKCLPGARDRVRKERVGTASVLLSRCRVQRSIGPAA